MQRGLWQKAAGLAVLEWGGSWVVAFGSILGTGVEGVIVKFHIGRGRFQ